MDHFTQPEQSSKQRALPSTSTTYNAQLRTTSYMETHITTIYKLLVNVFYDCNDELYLTIQSYITLHLQYMCI